MIATAKVVKVKKDANAVCLFDTVKYYIEEDEEEEERQIVTTLRQDVLKGYLSKESPLGKALLGKKVALVGLDIRKPMLANYLNLPSQGCLTSYLSDDSYTLEDTIVTSSIKNLDILPAGVIPPNPSELLGSEKNKELIEILKKEYDLIILDCPPLNCVTDSLILTSLASQAIIVSAYKKTPMDLLLTSKKSLESTGIKISGIVFNKIEQKGKNHYYYNKYYQ
jgi:capsular exopolysaccharide synthesis family protein